eukprot:14226397-Heterocapsa_arctica.AAC.1
MLPRPLGPAPARCSYAREMLGPHDPPRTEACLGEGCGSTAGPTMLMTTDPKSLRKHDGSWRGLCPSVCSAPTFCGKKQIDVAP